MVTTSTEIVAEIGANHHQSYQRAVALIYTAKRVGANAVKIQMFTPDSLTLDSDDALFKIKSGPWAGRQLYELYKEACLPYDWLPELKNIAESEGLGFIVSVYDVETVDICEEIGISRYKIASFEITFENLIKKIDSVRKPVIISTGSATFKEIESVVKTVRRNNLTLLKCTSAYPARLDSMNLRTIPAMAHRFKVPVGLSDHSLGIVAPVTAVALGAVMVEKHLTLDGEGLDGSFSVMPDTFDTMVKTIRATEEVLGNVDYGGPKSFHRKEINGKWIRVVH